MTDMGMNKFLQQMAVILEETALQPGDELQSFPQWDSLSVLSVIAMVDASYGVNLRAADLQQACTVGDLWTLVQSKMPASAG